MNQHGRLMECIRRKRAIVFDLFHTLVAVETSRGSRLPTTSAMLGIESEIWDRLLTEQSHERHRGVQREPFDVVASLARKVIPGIPDDVIRGAVDNRIARFEGALIDVPDVSVRLLKSLRAQGKLVGLVSNADVMEVTAWGRSPLKDLFDATVFSCDVGFIKPEPEIYRLCTDRLAVRPDECAFVGDGGSHELAGARALGFVTIMTTAVIKLRWPERIALREKDADFVVEDLSELLS